MLARSVAVALAVPLGGAARSTEDDCGDAVDVPSLALDLDEPAPARDLTLTIAPLMETKQGDRHVVD